MDAEVQENATSASTALEGVRPGLPFIEPIVCLPL
jgi:hypothetical protein